jgi:methylglutaconyl-CoA hydratase
MPFDARRALEIGLIHEIALDANDLARREERLADLAFAAAPGAVADAKALVDDVSGRPIDHALCQETARRIARRRASPEGVEGLSAFLEKRDPAWARPAG